MVKLTDSEIVKALECCTDGSGTGLIKATLDLINRLQADKKNLQERNVILRGLVDTQKAEIERLKPFEDKIAEFKSHIRVEDMLVFASSLEEWLEFCDNLKAEAYKECIEKVKERSSKMELVCSGALVRTDYTITKENLDNLLKELERKENTTYDD